MTEETIAAEGTTTESCQACEDFTEEVGYARIAVPEANKATRLQKQGVAWLHNTMYAALMRKVGTAAKFEALVKAQGASEEILKLVHDQLAQCAVLRDVWAPIVKTVKKTYVEESFAESVVDPVGEWFGRDYVFRECDLIIDFVHKALTMAYHVPYGALNDAAAVDETLSDDQKRTLLLALVCWDAVNVEKDHWLRDDYDREPARPVSNHRDNPATWPKIEVTLEKDAWRKFSSDLTVWQKAEFLRLQSVLRQAARPCLKWLESRKPAMTESIRRGFLGMERLLAQAKAEENVNQLPSEWTSEKERTDHDVEEVKEAPLSEALAEACGRLSDKDAPWVVSSFVSGGMVVSMYVQMPAELKEKLLKEAKVGEGLFREAARLTVKTMRGLGRGNVPLDTLGGE